MKTKCSFILKSSIALVLTVLVLFGSISTVLAATVDMSSAGYYWEGGTYRFYGSINDWSKTSNYLSGTAFTSGDGGTNDSHYVTIYLTGSSSSSNVYYRFYEADTNNTSDFCPNSGSDTKATTSGQQSKEGTNGAWYIDKKDLGTSSSTWYSVRVNQKHYSWQGTWYAKTALSAMSTTLTTKKGSTSTTSFTQGDTISLSATTSNAVGTATYAYAYKLSTASSYTDISGTSLNTSSLAPGTYTIQVTSTDGGVVQGKNAESNRIATATKNITIASATTPSIKTFTIDGGSSKTLNVGGTATLASTTENTTKSVTYSTTSDAISISGTTVTAVKPVTSATITATLVDGSTYTKTVTVKVNAPTLKTMSAKTVYVGETVQSDSPSITANAPASGTVTYTYSSGTTSVATINSSGLITGVKAGTSTITVTAKLGSVTLNTTTFTVTVKDRETVYMNAYTSGGTNVLEAAGNIMTYDKQLGLYKYTTTALSKSSTYYINIWDTAVSKNYRPTTGVAKSYPTTGNGLTGEENTGSTKMTTSALQGTYTFYYNYTSHKFYVDYPAAYTVTLNPEGGTLSTTSVGYEGTDIDLTAAAYTPTRSGYKFLGWYTAASGGTKVTKVTGLTGNVTYHAHWEQAYTISVSAGTGGKISPTTASYQVGATAVALPTATANDGYDFDGWTTTGSVTVSDKTKASGATMTATGTGTVTANFKAKPTYKISAVSNKSSRGTVAVNRTSAYVGQTVTITVSPKNGVLKALSYSYAGGDTYNYNFTTKTFVKQTASTSAAAPASVADKGVLAATGAIVEQLAAMAADSTYTFTMESTANVTVNATFDAYSAESEYYYNGYGSTGSALSDYTAKRMTEVMLNGVPYSYYEVTGRSGGEQLMTVSKGGGTSKFYVETPNTTDWNGNDNMRNPYIYWFDDDWGTFEKLTYDSTHGVVDGKKWWYTTNVHEGKGCVIVNMNNTSDGGFKQSADITAEQVAYGAVWIESGMADGKYKIGGEFSASDLPSDAGSGQTHYYYNDSDRYYGHVDGFNDDDASWNSSNYNNHTYAKPNKNLTGSYYVMVFYAGNTYTSGSNTLNLTGTANHDVVMWSTELPGGGDEENVTVYAKDGAINADNKTMALVGDTKIYAKDGTSAIGTSVSASSDGQSYETYKATKGETIVIETSITNATYKAKYYVRGFVVNGVTPEVYTYKDTGKYTLTYTIPEDYEGKYVEVTPVYYLKDTETNPVITFRVTGFTDNLKEVGTGKPNWGDTLFCYPFYGALSNVDNAFGTYPGQPLIHYNGQYSIQIPEKSTSPFSTTGASTYVSGVTMSNGYYDTVHKKIMGYGDNSTSADHVQTYDYDDFYKIYNEKSKDGNKVDNIVFDFKYKTTPHNLVTSITSPTPTTFKSTYGDNFEQLKNYHGRAVDLFGDALSGDAADPTKTPPLYVVSIGGVKDTSATSGTAGVENIAGYYATEWMVYKTTATTVSTTNSYSKVSVSGKDSIPPSVLVLNDDDTTSFNTSTYPSAVSGKNITDWKALYTELEKYRGKPVMITYEAADAQQGKQMYYTGTGGATRNDGRWLYSKNGESITSNIKIQYSNDNGTSYTDLNTTTPQVTGLSAYFTNAEADGKTTYATTIDPDKTYDFEAKTTNADYKFVGWYFDNGVKITDSNVGSTERSGSYTLVARFKLVTEGQLVLSHSSAKGAVNSTNYQGDGITTIAVTVTSGDGEVIRTYDATTSDITLDEKVISSDKTDYVISVTLTATPSGEDTYGTTTSSNTSFYKAGSTSGKVYSTNFDFTVGDLYSNASTQSVKSIIYHSYFNQVQYNYKLTFNFPARDGTTKSYVREGTLTAAQRAAYVNDSKVLAESFFNTLVPYESNFNQSLQFTFSESDRKFAADGSNYKLVKTFTAEDKSEKATRTVTFSLPYAHTNGVPVDTESGTAADTTNLKITAEYGKVVKNSDDAYVTAPKQVGDNYFQYWSIKTTDADGAEVARCYWNEFNFIAYDNYYITPVYAATEYDYHNSGAFTNITYLDTTRNQWNTNGESSTTTTAAADLLYNDFMLNYNYNGLDIYRNGTDVSAVTDLGYIVERVQQLDLKQDGTRDTTMSKYAGKGLTADAAKDVVTDYNKKGATQNGITKYTGSDSRIARYSVAKTALDNKNRIEIYDAYYNAAGWDKNDQDFVKNYAYKNYVYKVYTYMVVEGTTYVSEVPAYFTMYNEAVKTADQM